MSRAYRIQLSEKLQRVLRAKDHVSSQIELLEILPQEQMAQLLEQELERRGFVRGEEGLVREQNGVKVTVDPATGTITVHSELCEEASLQIDREARVFDDWQRESREKMAEAAREELRRELEAKAQEKTEKLQKEATDRLEGELADIQKEIGQAVNRVTGEALKRKAAQLGQIKEMTEDPQSGSLTIVLEV
jgi:F0F1-type ATP synthase membrane subunit b/b'